MFRKPTHDIMIGEGKLSNAFLLIRRVCLSKKLLDKVTARKLICPNREISEERTSRIERKIKWKSGKSLYRPNNEYVSTAMGNRVFSSERRVRAAKDHTCFGK